MDELRRLTRSLTLFQNVLILTLVVILLVFLYAIAKGAEVIDEPKVSYYASWYSTSESLKKMANGNPLDDNAFTCASWWWPLGAILKVTNTDNDKSVLVVVTDRGPALDLCVVEYTKEIRVVDLSKRAFKSLGQLENGIIPIKVERVQ